MVEDARRHPLVRTNPAIRELRLDRLCRRAAHDRATAGRRARCASSTRCPRSGRRGTWPCSQDLAASVVTEIELRASAAPPRRGAVPPPPVTRRPRDPAAGVFDVSALPMGLIDADGRWLRVNRAPGRAARRRRPEALAGCPAEAFTHPADRAADHEAIAAAAGRRVRQLHRGEAPARGPAASRCWVLATVTAAAGRPGTPAALHVALAGHRRPEAGRGRPARARGALPAGGGGHPGRRVGLGPADRPDRLERAARTASFGYPPRAAGAHGGWWYERLHADDRERVVSGIHAAIARRRHGLDRRVPLPPRRRAATRTCSDRGGHRPRRGRRRRCGWSARWPTSASGRGPICSPRGQSRLLEQIAAGLDLERGARAGGALRRGARRATCSRRVMVLDPETRELRLAPGPSLPEEAAGGARRGAGRVRREPERRWRRSAASAWSWRTWRPIVCGAAWRGPLLAHGIRAAWSTPLFATDGALLGTLEVLLPRAAGARARSTAGWSSSRATWPRSPSSATGARRRSPGALRLLEQVLDTPAGGRLGAGPRWADHVRQPRRPAIWGGARFVGIDDFGEYRGWWADTGEPIAPEDGPRRAPSARARPAQRGRPHRELRRRPADDPQLRRAAPQPRWRDRRRHRPQPGHHASSARPRRRSAGARSSCATRRRWRRWASSPAGSPTTSTTCSPAS